MRQTVSPRGDPNRVSRSFCNSAPSTMRASSDRSRSSLKVTVFGSGYAGLVTAACLADSGNQVTRVDVDAARVQLLKDGHCLLATSRAWISCWCAMRAPGASSSPPTPRRQSATARPSFIAVGTPPQRRRFGRPAVRAAGGAHDRRVHADYRGGRHQVNRAGGHRRRRSRAALGSELSARARTIAFDVVSNPEFLKEGAAVEDFMPAPTASSSAPTAERAIELMRQLYAPYNRNRDRLMSWTCDRPS